MRLNVFRTPSIYPEIAHMRIAYEDGIRKQTEEYWRGRITEEIRQSLSCTCGGNNG